MRIVHLLGLASLQLALAGCASGAIHSDTSDGGGGGGGGTGGGGGARCELPATDVSLGVIPEGDGPSPDGVPFVTTWASALGTAAAVAVAADPGGDVFVAGIHVDALAIGGATLPADPAGAGFLARLDAAGHARWAHRAPFAIDDLAADGAGGVWIGSEDDGHSRATHHGADGELLGAIELPVPGPIRVVAAGDGGALVAAQARGALLLGHGVRVPLASTFGADGAFVVRVDANGGARWATALAQLAWTTPPRRHVLRRLRLDDLAAAPGGGAIVLVTADEEGTVGEDCRRRTSALARIEADGRASWRRPLPVSNGERKIAVDPGGVIAVGETLGAGEDGGLGYGGSGVGVALFGPDGDLRWSKHARGSSAMLRPMFDATGGVVVAGSYFRTIDLGGGPLPDAGGSGRLFVARFSSTGAHLTSRSFDGANPPGVDWVSAGDDSLAAAALDATGALLLAGDYSGALDLGTGPLPNEPIEANAGVEYAGFLARIGP